jgi:hypothetical protein
MNTTDKAFKGLRALWIFLAAAAVIAILVLLGVLVNQGSKPPPKPETQTKCYYTPSEGYVCWQAPK